MVRALSNLTSDNAEMRLCPVRALKHYHKVASELVPDRPRFFISNRDDHAAINKNTLSTWLVKLIWAALRTATEGDIILSNAKVLEIRAIASSLAYQTTYSIDDVLSAASWSNHTTFTDYYLREVSGLEGKLHVLTPLVVAGTTMH